jgi:hypothetical protein
MVIRKVIALTVEHNHPGVAVGGVLVGLEVEPRLPAAEAAHVLI